MISIDYVQTMVTYSKWQNGSIFTAASGLSDAERRQDRGAFFDSIHATLNHLLWADQIWMHRLTDFPQPEPFIKTIKDSVHMHLDWQDLVQARQTFDEKLLSWSSTIDEKILEGDLTWFSASAKREITHPKWVLFTHLFNHQTHHRGQVHVMLTAAGAKPDDTDIPFTPDLFQAA